MDPHWLTDSFAGFRYITFRAACAAVTAFLLCLLLGPLVIRLLSRRRIHENIEKKDSERLSELHKEKRHTPTMGGLFVIAAVVLSAAIWIHPSDPFAMWALLVIVGHWLLGFLDDFIKLTLPGRKGLNVLSKLSGQILIGLLVGYGITISMQELHVVGGRDLWLPLLKVRIDLGLAYPFFAMLVIVSASNAVNITDGLDGLATGCITVAALCYAGVAYAAGRFDYSRFMEIPYVPGAGELAVLCAAIAGAGLGFLWYNCNPASIFLGNTGALPLGAALGFVALVSKQELLLFLIGAIFVIETVTVIIQIISFRCFGRRVFKIAPIHHHFQFEGWAEPKIVIRFWIVAAVLALLSFAVLKARWTPYAPPQNPSRAAPDRPR
ncbi:MAG: phospho-N-acetylmuramoyl-pentapeptide-transferase [Planctomycetes bacterium]|nr:phospho-N-acetylmuramoyl-pentapeptide-transferase [Planctomycetota bacterium]